MSQIKVVGTMATMSRGEPIEQPQDKDPERAITRELPVPREDRQFNRYWIQRELGRGGMGVVYLAEDRELNRMVALKVLREDVLVSQEGRERFAREIAVTARLEHPNIIRLYDSGKGPGGETYFTMEYVPGSPLEDVLYDRALEPAESLQLMLPLCRATEHAHQHGVLHRDIKPANVLLDEAGSPKLTDFGLAGMLQADQQAQRLTQSQSTLGTASYMAPEQAEGNVRAMDRRSDVYGLGALMYELLTGRPPFEEENFVRTLRAVIAGKIEPPRAHRPAIHPEIETICLKALERRRQDRYDTAAALAEDIEAFLAGRPISARPPGPILRLRKWAWRNKVATAIILVVMLATAASYIGVLRQLAIARSGEREAQQNKRVEDEQRSIARRLQRNAEQSQADFDLLADVQALKELRNSAETLWPRRPRHIVRYQEWLDRARALIAHGEEHRRTIAQLRAMGDKLPAAKRVLLRALDGLVKGTVALEDPRDEYGNSLAGISRRLAFALELSRRATRDRLPWTHAIESIRRSPVYGGLDLGTIEGLLPLGQDPGSGLWEFAHLGTGDPPEREDGKLVITEKTGLVLILVPPGSFMMGANPRSGPNRDPQANNNERPMRTVELAPFFLSKYEMTQAQWRRVTGENPSKYYVGRQAGEHKITPVNPVTDVDWHTCKRVLERLGLRLPTEAQWEYAARAGTHTVWAYGSRVADLQGKCNVSDFATRQEWPHDPQLDDGHIVHAPVGSFLPTRWGFHDIVGNVAEWTLDLYANYKVRPRPGDGLRYLRSYPDVIARGGSFLWRARYGRSAYRWNIRPGYRSSSLGLRPAASLPGKARSR